ncbi:hypothetical protein E5K00_17170 [Hymenobacter aquaticus]|uniref:RHS repeat protein n=1 Tax=Hymenobacter aquaticus TaxID=1867101 RepID=A0A4Z0PWY6_9BACT|nr:hypothetical protein [Hymenobacter aquaticus]TGE21985.1 hypothetical protein E5K00_17170 [Hymenobacter aquaticus]
MRFFPASAALMLSILAAQPGYAQAPSLRQPRLWEQTQWRLPHQAQPSPPPTQTSILVQPIIPVDADGSIKVEPDSATRHLYARHKVRAVLKVRLNSEGQVQDTVEYQGVDPQGRWTQVGISPRRVRRQWSFNADGLCTALVEYAHPKRPYTVITTYNPSLGRGQQEVVQPDGKHDIVSEKRLYRSGDTLLTEIRGQALNVQHYFYPAYYQRSLRLSPHPDTVLSLTCFYNEKQEITSFQADYLLYRQGLLVENGKLNLPETSRAKAVRYAPDATGFPDPGRLLAALRQGRGLHAQRRRFYDQQHRLIRQEINHSVHSGAREQLVRNVVHYTYNALGQLIGREGSLTTDSAPGRAGYAVFSYLPSGLLQGETTDARSAKPAFYRYQYEYYE